MLTRRLDSSSAAATTLLELRGVSDSQQADALRAGAAQTRASQREARRQLTARNPSATPDSYKRKLVDALPTPREFSARASSTYKDERGRVYLLPAPTDTRYLQMARSGEIGRVQRSNFARIDASGTHKQRSVMLPQRTLMYVKMPRRKRVFKTTDGADHLPHTYAAQERLTGVFPPAIGEQLQLLSTSGAQLYTARVHSVFFLHRSRIGFVILQNVAWFGTISDPSEFGVHVRN